MSGPNGQDITIEGPNGAFSGYLAQPVRGTGAGPIPGLVVIQEIFGVNQAMRGLCDWFASQGFLALCPDLFWRLEPGLQLSADNEEEMSKAFDLYGKFDIDQGIADIQATIGHLRTLDGTAGKIGAVGYCLGGLLAFLAAARTDADASVGYYGVNIQSFLGEAANIKKPLMLHIAANDAFVPKQAQDQILAGLKEYLLVTVHQYAGQEHAFARPGGEHYDEQAAALANRRTLDFFRLNLA